LQQFINSVDFITYFGGEVDNDPRKMTMIATDMGLDFAE